MMTSEAHIRVRFAETDQMGIVHHASYLVYFEVGRVEYARQHDVPYDQLEEEGFSLAVTEVHIRYRRAAQFDQQLVVRTCVEKISSRGITFTYTIVDHDTDETIVTGYTKHLCLDRTGAVCRIPARWQQAMQPKEE